MDRLFILTPLRDEAANIPRLVESLRAQTRPIDYWIVLENGSTDGSKEMLAALKPGGGIRQIVVLSLQSPIEAYALGSKYASIINSGIEYVTTNFEMLDNDMIGLMDADTFARPDYYAALEKLFDGDPKIGMACGLADRPGGDKRTTRWTGGGYFVWRYACLRQAGYLVGPTADIMSAAKAHVSGWRLRVTRDTEVETRGQGKRVDFSYYGRAAYFRGETVVHCLARFCVMLARGRFTDAVAHASGFFGDLRKGAPRVEDREVRGYFQKSIQRRLKETLGLETSPGR